MHTVIQRRLEESHAELRQLCDRLSVRELRIFGSATTPAFDPSRSDLDLIADFEQPEAPGIADRYMDLIDGLQRIFGRPIDLVTRPALRNPIFRRIVEETSEPVYAR
jgi:predicted nucleotidyltransferase